MGKLHIEMFPESDSALGGVQLGHLGHLEVECFFCFVFCISSLFHAELGAEHVVNHALSDESLLPRWSMVLEYLPTFA